MTTGGFAFVFRECGGLTESAVEEAARRFPGASPRVWISPRRDVAVLSGSPCAMTGLHAAAGHHGPAAWVWGRLEGGAGPAAQALLRDRPSAAKSMYGDYAWLFWDGRSAAISAGTDHVAMAPLYYTQDAGGFAVSTCLPVLLCLPGTSTELDYTSLALLIAGDAGSEDGATPWQHIRKLRGGHTLELQHGKPPQFERWWRPDEIQWRTVRRPADCADEFRSILEAAVESRLPQSGEAGVTMSGGLDSTLVAGMAARQLASRQKTLHAWTAVPDPALECRERSGWDTNDWAYASLVASSHPNIRHSAVSSSGICILDVLNDIAERSATPVRNSANMVWLLAIARRASDIGVSTILGGGRGNATISYAGNGALEAAQK